jgi:excinuclease ABC subunit C
MHLKDKAKQLPELPGVYMMKDAQSNIIYVGKAKSLKNRVSQYFQNSRKHTPKIVRMVESIKDFETISADTELEALLLECRLIKDLKPIYNSQLKNHQRYVFININIEEPYPTIEVVAEKKEAGLNFGPYNSLSSAERGANAIKENMRLRHCRSLSSKDSGCLNYQLGFCSAPCSGEISNHEYRRLVDQAVDFLKGGKSDLIKQLNRRMKAAAEVLDFDKAVKYRDDLAALRHLMYKGETVKFTGDNRCIAALEKMEGSEYKFFLIKGSRIIYKNTLLYTEDKSQLQQHMVSMILQNRAQLQKREAINIDKQDIDQVQIVYSYLKNKRECSYIVVPQSWLKKKDSSKLEQGIMKLSNML